MLDLENRLRRRWAKPLALLAVLVVPLISGSCSSKTPTSPLQFDYQQAYAGDYLISALKTQDTGCNFNRSYSGTMTVAVNPDGSNFRLQIKEFVTRVYTGTVQQNGTFSTSGTNTFFGFTAAGTVTGQLGSGFAASGTETLNLTKGCPESDVVSYSLRTPSLPAASHKAHSDGFQP